MQRHFYRPLFAAVAILSIFTWSCTKIDTTELGADLIPAVDNVNTFDTVINIMGTQGVFTDTTRIGSTDNHVLGNINNDRVFGTTKANVYLELKPNFYPYYFGNAGDTIELPSSATSGFDSLVFCLSYRGFYGDTSLPQRFKLFALSNQTTFRDSTYLISYQPDIPPTQLLGEVTVKATDLATYTRFKNGDSINNQIRIKITDQAFINSILSGDSTATGQFKSDSLFREKFKGFAVIAESDNTANGLFYVNLEDAGTRLEIHYRGRKNNVTDTSYSIFPLSVGTTTAIPASASANYVVRDSSTSEFKLNPSPDALYIQSTPGTYANITIPELSGLSNRIIHRAEIILEQIPDPIDPTLDARLPPPGYLYLDISSPSGLVRYKPIYHDLNPTSTYDPDNSAFFFPSGGISGVDFAYFGGFRRFKTENGVTTSYFSFNVSRYVQKIVTNDAVNYMLRIYAPYQLSYYNLFLPYNNSLAFGRLKVGNGNNASHPLRMRIIYSKI